METHQTPGSAEARWENVPFSTEITIPEAVSEIAGALNKTDADFINTVPKLQGHQGNVELQPMRSGTGFVRVLPADRPEDQPIPWCYVVDAHTGEVEDITNEYNTCTRRTA